MLVGSSASPTAMIAAGVLTPMALVALIGLSSNSQYSNFAEIARPFDLTANGGAPDTVRLGSTPGGAEFGTTLPLNVPATGDTGNPLAPARLYYSGTKDGETFAGSVPIRAALPSEITPAAISASGINGGDTITLTPAVLSGLPTVFTHTLHMSRGSDLNFLTNDATSPLIHVIVDDGPQSDDDLLFDGTYAFTCSGGVLLLDAIGSVRVADFEDQNLTNDVEITGLAQEGQTLGHTGGAPSGNPLPTPSYAWRLLSDDSLVATTATPPPIPTAWVGDRLYLEVTVSDGVGPDVTRTSLASEAIQAIPVTNTPPAAIDDTALTTPFESALSIDVLANDTDLDGDTLTIQSFTQGANGVVTQVADDLVYTPATGFSGADSFTYTITDGTDTDTATVSITVEAEIIVPTIGTPSLSGSDLSFDYSAPGTIFWSVTTAEEDDIADIEAGLAAEASDSFAVAASGSTSQALDLTGLTAGTRFLNFFLRSAGGDSLAQNFEFTFEVVQAQTLSQPLGVSSGQTTAVWTATSSEPGGTIFAAARLSADEVLEDTEIENGTGDAVAISNDATPTADANNGGPFTGLTAGASYVVDMFHRVAGGANGPVISSPAFVTDSAAASGDILAGVGDFSSAAGWSLTTETAITGGQFEFNNTVGTFNRASHSDRVIAAENTTYDLSLDVTAITNATRLRIAYRAYDSGGGNISGGFQYFFDTNADGALSVSTMTKAAAFTTPAGTATLEVTLEAVTAGMDIDIDNLSLTEA